MLPRKMIFFVNLHRTLGLHLPYSEIITSAALSTIAFFYVFTISSFFAFTVYPLRNRITYYVLFEAYVVNQYVDYVIIGCTLFVWLFFSLKKRSRLISVIVPVVVLTGIIVGNETLLNIIALSSIPIPVSLLIYNKLRKNVLISNSSLTLNYIATLVGVLGIVGIVLVSITILVGQDMPVRNYTLEIFLVLSLISPQLMLMLISSVPLKIVIESGKKALQLQDHADIPTNHLRRKSRIVLLGLIMLLSVVMTLIPHLPTVNKDGQQVGVDTPYYVGWLALLKTSDPVEVLQQTFVFINEGDRAISLIFIYAITSIVNADTFLVIEYLPVILGPLLVLVIYFLARELLSNDYVSLLASFITAVSYQVLIGIYAGFYSNWFALIVGYLAFLFLVRYLKNPSTYTLVIFSGLVISLLFTHVYTWSIFAIAMGLFLATMFKLRPAQRKSISILIIIVVSTAAIDVSRIVLFGQAGGLEREIQVAEGQAGIEQFISRWNNLQYGIHAFLGGLFSNFVLLGLGLYWLYRSRTTDLVGIFIITYFSVGLIPLLLGDWLIQTRVLYNMPFQIPAAIGLFLISRQSGRLLAVSFCIFLVWMALVNLSNFHFALPVQESS